MSETAEEYFDQEEVAARYRVSPRTVEGWRARGLGPRYVRVGGRIKYRRTDCEKYELARTFRDRAEELAAAPAA